MHNIAGSNKFFKRVMNSRRISSQAIYGHHSDDNPYPWDNSHAVPLNCICIIAQEALSDRAASLRDSVVVVLSGAMHISVIALRLQTRSAAINLRAANR